MSIPHTGKLTAEYAGFILQFDGHTWTCDDHYLVRVLNESTVEVMQTHIGIVELAEAVFRDAGLSGAVILSVRQDAWSPADQLPPDSID